MLLHLLTHFYLQDLLHQIYCRINFLTVNNFSKTELL